MVQSGVLGLGMALMVAASADQPAGSVRIAPGSGGAIRLAPAAASPVQIAPTAVAPAPAAGSSAPESAPQPVAEPPEAAPAPPPEPATPAVAAALPAQAAAAPAGPAVTYVVRTKKPSFVLTSTGSVAFGVIGALASINEGKKIVEDNEIEDPAVRLGLELATHFAASKGGVVAPGPLVIAGDKPEDLKPKAVGVRYVVDLQTTVWNAIYFPTDWGHYGLLYGAVFKVVDMQSETLVAKGKCFIKPVHSASSPTKSELLADQAAGLKALGAEAGSACLMQLDAAIAGH